MNVIRLDITDRNHTEQASAQAHEFLHSCIDALSSHIAVLDEDGEILAVNEAWRQFAKDNGFNGRNYGIGSNYVDACQPTSGECAECILAAAGLRDVLHGRKEQFQLEYPCHSPTGNRWFLLRVTRFNTTGPVRLMVAHENVTERRLAEEALKDASRRKDEFLAMLAHELRNPLAPIRHALQIMRFIGGDGQLLHSAFEIMERQIGQMVRIVDDLVDVSRISRGTVELRKEEIELASVIYQAVEAASPHIANMGHKLTVTLPPEPIHLNGDLTRLAQAVSNLLNNASKFTNAGGRIYLTVERDGEHAVINVKDSGVGIAVEQLPLIFDTFTQLDGSLERSESGLGIDLTLVKNLVEMHDGTVEAYSAGVGHGCEFVLRLPIRDQMTPKRPEPIVSELQATTSRRILVVDDNRDSATSLATFLELVGNETHTAFDGIEAVETAEALQPDIVLLDIGMPKLNGYDAARKIREQPWGERMVLVALTGWGQEEDRRKAREAGFNYHIVKPVDPASITTLLSSLSPEHEIEH